MIKLDDREWKEFHIDEVFITEEKGNVPTGGYVKKELLSTGDTPRITVTSQNNGVDNYWKDISNNNYKTHTNFISVSFLGDVFYHKGKASIDMKVHCLQPKNRELNDDLALFLCRALRNNTEISSYGNQLSSYDLARKSILLPVDDEENPDYDFMEAYSAQIKKEKVGRYSSYCERQLLKLGKAKKIESLKEKEWHEFFVGDIFMPPKRGKRIISDNYIEGNIPVVSSAGGNNGVIAFAGNKDKVRKYKNCLSVANGGVSAGYAFFHPYEFIATDHVTHFEGESLNMYHYLFLGTIIKNQMHEKYDFSREMTDPRLQREIILVPINDEGEPDYDYMEQYSKNILINKYSKYIEK